MRTVLTSSSTTEALLSKLTALEAELHLIRTQLGASAVSTRIPNGNAINQWYVSRSLETLQSRWGPEELSRVRDNGVHPVASAKRQGDATTPSAAEAAKTINSLFKKATAATLATAVLVDRPIVVDASYIARSPAAVVSRWGSEEVERAGIGPVASPGALAAAKINAAFAAGRRSMTPTPPKQQAVAVIAAASLASSINAAFAASKKPVQPKMDASYSARSPDAVVSRWGAEEVARAGVVVVPRGPLINEAYAARDPVAVHARWGDEEPARAGIADPALAYRERVLAAALVAQPKVNEAYAERTAAAVTSRWGDEEAARAATAASSGNSSLEAENAALRAHLASVEEEMEKLLAKGQEARSLLQQKVEALESQLDRRN